MAPSPTPEAIKESIRQYLMQVDGFSKAIEDIRKKCFIPRAELEKLPKRVKEARQVQEKIFDELQGLEYQLESAINKQNPSMKKLDKIHDKIQEKRQQLLDAEDRLNKLEGNLEIHESCQNDGDEIEESLREDYQAVVQKLLNARKMFPDLYKEVEDETGIHFFTPF